MTSAYYVPYPSQMNDPYRQLASRKFGVPYEDVTDEQRTAVKRAVFATSYGATISGLPFITGDDIREVARHVLLSADDREAQRRSFVYGNLNTSNDAITREDIDKAAERR